MPGQIGPQLKAGRPHEVLQNRSRVRSRSRPRPRAVRFGADDHHARDAPRRRPRDVSGSSGARHDVRRDGGDATPPRPPHGGCGRLQLFPQDRRILRRHPEKGRGCRGRREGCAGLQSQLHQQDRRDSARPKGCGDPGGIRLVDCGRSGGLDLTFVRQGEEGERVGFRVFGWPVGVDQESVVLDRADSASLVVGRNSPRSLQLD